MQCETDSLRGDFTEAEIGCHLARDAALARGQYSILLTAEFTALRLAQLRGGATDAAPERLRQTLKENRQFLSLRTPGSGALPGWMRSAEAGADAWFMAPEADASFLILCIPCCGRCRMRCCWLPVRTQSCLRAGRPAQR